MLPHATSVPHLHTGAKETKSDEFINSKVMRCDRTVMLADSPTATVRRDSSSDADQMHERFNEPHRGTQAAAELWFSSVASGGKRLSSLPSTIEFGFVDERFPTVSPAVE